VEEEAKEKLDSTSEICGKKENRRRKMNVAEIVSCAETGHCAAGRYNKKA
jgi:hypothetical protein